MIVPFIMRLCDVPAHPSELIAERGIEGKEEVRSKETDEREEGGRKTEEEKHSEGLTEEV